MLTLLHACANHNAVDSPGAVCDAVQVTANPVKVTPKDYVHLHDTGYAGAWGWAWLNVTEEYAPITGVTLRGIDAHAIQGGLRSLLQGLPQRLRYPVQDSPVPVSAGGTVLG